MLLLAIKTLKKHFATQKAVDDISLSVEKCRNSVYTDQMVLEKHL
jgi:ABC-type uncharacterized transport system ATPase subunit